MTSDRLASQKVFGDASVSTWIGAVGVVAGAIITGFFGWLGLRHRARHDAATAKTTSAAAIEVAVISEWQKLNRALADRVTGVEKELAQVRSEHAAELEKIRKDHAEEIQKIRRDHSAEIDTMRRQHREEMRELRDQNDELRRQNEGLMRMISQNSHSTAHLMGDDPGIDGK